MTTHHILVWQTCWVILDGGRLRFGVMIRVSRCFIKSCMDWSLYQFLHILNVPWYKHAIILLLTGRSILLSVGTTIHSSQWRLFSGTGYQLVSSLIQILTFSNQESARSTIDSLRHILFYLAFKLFFLTLTLSSMLTIILHFLCCTISLFLLLLTHHAQHIQIILVRGFWITRR